MGDILKIANKMNNKNKPIFYNEKDELKHVTVLGSGIMGSGIAAHFANIGVKFSFWILFRLN